MKPVSRRDSKRVGLVHNHVMNLLCHRIGEGEWLPGQRLPSIHQLTRELGAGAGSIREALRAMESQGIITIQHGRGIFVESTNPPNGAPARFAALGIGAIVALCEARRVLEPELAAFAAERGTDGELTEIHRLAQDMEQRAAAGADFLDPDLQFHRKIAAAAHNQVLESMIESVTELFLEGRKITVELPGMTPRAVRYHLLISEALLARSAEQARLLMAAHINDTTQSLIRL